ncbi:thioredoxin family protein [Thalassobacillus devorans]|uniref:thioredoxin family protein n=1 Tax=Thalassobacillus devorans TaxID=279813 RepID=UPI000491D190|nr:thioredoxin family protein [Thalassobacillus devorans]
MTLEEWFQKGVTAQEYVDSMEKYQKDLIYIYENFQIPTEDQGFFEQVQKQNLRVIVLTEDWCGDAMLNIPILLKFAEAGHMNVHLLSRDENPELMDQYLTNGVSRSIPIFIFFDPEGNEVANWGPRAESIETFIQEAKKTLPKHDPEDFKLKQQQMFQFITKSYRDNQDFWKDVYESLKQSLNQLESSLP